MKKIYIVLILLNCALLINGKSIVHSKHNLSLTGTGDINTSETGNVCMFCHTSHVPGGNKGPLWNREKSNIEYIVYGSSTLYSKPGQPDGASKLCLSCHDGNIAMGRILRGPKDISVKNTEGGRIPRNRRSNLGRDISDDHPVSFDSTTAVALNPELKHPGSGDHVSYDRSGKIQCTSCHDPHEDVFPGFLVKNIINGELCKTCHDLQGYSGISTHDVSMKTWNGSGKNPWSHTDFNSVMENSCQNCHHPHNAGNSERLLSERADSQVCLVCHNGNTGSDIKSEVEKIFSHNVERFNNIHDPAENILTASVHTQCVDCHDPHKVNSSGASPPYLNGRLKGVSGVTIGGSVVAEAQYEFEVCLKCHGQDRYNKMEHIRQYQNPNIRIAFQPSNKSFHPAASQGNGNYVPSLRPEWNSSSRMYCTDCHSSNNGKKNGGSGPDGPHGSIHEYILERKYLVAPSMFYQQSNYELCWKCHRPEVVMSENFSTFKYHKKHVDEQSTPCSVCHDPHGSQRNPGLINFDTSAVFPNLNGELKFEIIGNKGYCYLQCHGDDHSPKEYEK
ncbi:MAG: cytochrome c3 family protein [Acidobacteriota bacterium]